MQVCPSCAYTNRDGVLLCENCGKPMRNTLTISAATKTINSAPGHAWEGRGTTRLAPHQAVLFYVRGSQKPIVLQPTTQTITLGRALKSDRAKPDVDLTQYRAFEKGVSRIHATMTRDGETLVITDMSSANGTYVNGQLLVPGQPCVLRHADEVRLGELVANVYFH